MTETQTQARRRGPRQGWRRAGAGLAGTLALAAVLLVASPAPPHAAAPTVAAQQVAFDHWRAANPQGARQADAFEAYLLDQGVADVVPLAGLLAGDSQLAARMGGRCPVAAFAVPPRALWPNMVPVLQAVRSHVMPAVGPVRVVSGWREPDFNACVGGASRSHHTRFAAVDLVPFQPAPAAETMDRLCAMWRRSPTAARIGLGAYLDPDRPQLNRDGRFHVDVRGKRTWGFGYRSPTSWCHLRG